MQPTPQFLPHVEEMKYSPETVANYFEAPHQMNGRSDEDVAKPINQDVAVVHEMSEDDSRLVEHQIVTNCDIAVDSGQPQDSKDKYGSTKDPDYNDEAPQSLSRSPPQISALDGLPQQLLVTTPSVVSAAAFSFLCSSIVPNSGVAIYSFSNTAPPCCNL